MPTKFQEKVYNLLKKIPKGKVVTYKILANKLNSKAYRAVGTAMRMNEHPDKIPCFKVVKSDGKIGGYCGTFDEKIVAKKIKLLKNEGIIIEKGKIKDFEKRLWK